jgi:hypothetical protein
LLGLAILFGSLLATVGILSFQNSRYVLLGWDFLRPLVLMNLVGLLYLSLLQTNELSVPLEVTPRVRFLEFILAVDNELPYYLADCLYQQRDPRPYFLEHLKAWQSSDRPPLQAGLLLLQMPLFYATKHPRDLGMVASIALQCTWVPALLALWQAGGLSRKQSGIALLLVTFSGFALVNTVYTWPKMLPASLVVVSIIVWFFDRGPQGAAFPMSKALFCAMAMALAMLAHGSVAFTLLPLGLFLLLPRFYPGWSRVMVTAGVFVALYYPWSWYQKHYDPPGDRLLRQHLAGSNPNWDSGRSLLGNLWNAYADVNAQQMFHNKLENLRMLVNASRDLNRWPAASETPAEWATDTIGFRRCDFSCVFWALGLLNVGWIVAPIRLRQGATAVNLTLGVVVPALAVASIVIWIALMFGPRGTVVYQGSYATMLLLFGSLTAWLASLPGRIPYSLLILQGSLFAIGWLLTSPANQFSVPNVLMIPCSVLFFVVLAAVALRADPIVKNEVPRVKAP